MASNGKTNSASENASYPVARGAAFTASAALLVLVPIWQPDALLHVQAPLGYLDASISSWLTVLAVPLIALITISEIPVLLARRRYVGDFAGIDEYLGTRMSTLTAASQLVEFIATYALTAASIAFLIGSMWPSLSPVRTQIAIGVSMLIALFQWTQRGSRALRTGAFWVVLGFILLLVLTAGILGSSPYFAPTSPEDLAIVSEEVKRAPFAGGIAPALGLGLGVVLTPALLLRHLSADLSYFSHPNAKNAGVAKLAVAIAASLTAMLTMLNIADVDSARFIGRRNTFYSALRVVGMPEWMLIASTIIMIAVALTAARTVLYSAEKLSEELANFHLLPVHLMNTPTRRMFTPFLFGLGASALLLIGSAQFRFIVPTLALSGFTSLTLTRWSTLRLWNAKLRYEGHSRERRVMKRARLMALGGLVISLAALVLLFVSDMYQGAWIVTGLILLLYVILYAVRIHYLNYGVGAGEKTTEDPITPGRVHYMIVAQTMGPVLTRATRWIQSTRPYSIELLHVDTGGNDSEEALRAWREEGLGVDLTILDAGPARPTEAIIEHVRRVRAAHPNRLVNVVLPQVVFSYRLLGRLHNTEIKHLEKTLLAEPGVLITIVPWSE
ncbi:MAG: hypothetical protein Q4E01_06240 [Actinomycetaceae bacterium]|nr:hypothetical protein [Actinomycetaceae bacterium]